MILQQHPDYHDGFFDALDGEPLFEDASPEYAAGWRAFQECRPILATLVDGTDLPTATAAIMPARFARRYDA